MITRFMILGLMLSANALLLAGCGIKPGALEPPPGAENRQFPRTYPDPSTDPTP